MKKLLLGLLGLALIVIAALLILGRHVPPETTPQAATILPASTLAFVDIPDFQSCRAKVAASPLAPFWQNPEVQACFGKPFADWNGITTPGQSPTWLNTLLGGEAFQMPHGEAFLAITHMAIFPDAAPQFTFAAGINLPDHTLAMQASLKLLAYRLQQTNPGTTVTTKQHLGRNYTLCQMAPDTQISYAFFGSLLVFTSDEEVLRDGQLVNRFGLLLMAVASNNPLVQQLANIQAWGTGVTFGETNITDVGITTYEKPIPPEPPLRLVTRAAAPADSTFYLAGTPNLPNAYTTLLDLLKLSGNPNAVNLINGLGLALSFAGVDPANDLLARLGPETAGIGNWRTGAEFPDFALVAEVRDKTGFARKFDRFHSIIDKVSRTSAAVPYAGVTLRVIHTGGAAAPAYVLTDKFFVLALSADYAREVVSQIQTGKVSLTLGNGNAAADTECDLRLALAGLYSLAGTNTLPWLGPLPAPGTIARYVGNYTATTTANTASSTTTAHSPLGKPVTLGLAWVGGLAAAQSWLPELEAAIPALPKMSSGTPAPPRRAGNRTAASHSQSSQ